MVQTCGEGSTQTWVEDGRQIQVSVAKSGKPEKYQAERWNYMMQKESKNIVVTSLRSPKNQERKIRDDLDREGRRLDTLTQPD